MYSKDNPTNLFKTFNSQTETLIYFGTSKTSISKYFFLNTKTHEIL